MTVPEYARDLVLLGGGHTHALALEMLAGKLPSDVRITLISESGYSPYSGMLPGLVAGHYRFEDAHIDLRRLCGRLGVRFVQARAVGIDPEAGAVELAERPGLGYDVLSINIGAQPALDEVPGARRYATPVKPVAGFYARWKRLERALTPTDGRGERIAVVGGGAGSVELALAIRHRLRSRAIGIRLVCGGPLLESCNRGARAAVRGYLARANIELIERDRVATVGPDALRTESGRELEYDFLLWCTQAVAPGWPADSGLPCDAAGFVRVGDTLRVMGRENIFAAGDVAVQSGHPYPRAGVYAVRQAPVLAANLVALFRDRAPRRYRPQRRFLALLSMGGREAVADRGRFRAAGGWVWRWKDAIDRRFMARFEKPRPPMKRMQGPPAAEPAPMHCGGCGAKLPAGLLRGILAELEAEFPSIVDGADFRDDAALLDVPGDSRMVQSVDSLRELVDDPWLMGRIAALHALGDLYAMGAAPHSCLAQVTLPYGSDAVRERDLAQLMRGAMREMNAAGCRLVGGHSMEGPELSLGFTVNGLLARGSRLGKRGVRDEARLVLTKPLGTGVIFAAAARAEAAARHIDAALDSMLRTSAAAADIARERGAMACTDVTGFGLLGHLGEMLPAESGLQALLELDAVPLLPGVEALFERGFESSLQPGNREAATVDAGAHRDPNRLKALFDPQTSGGLLLALRPEQVAGALDALRSAGYGEAAEIGRVRLRPEGGGALRVE